LKLKTKWFRYKHSGVYENNLGDRVSPQGDLVMIDGITQRVRYYDNDPLFMWCLDIMGHRCKRALMLYVEKVRKM